MLLYARRARPSPTAPVALLSVARVALGILSQVLIAGRFGTARQLDMYFIAFAGPSMVLGIVLALFGSSMMPVLERDKGSPERFSRSVSTLFVYVLAVSLLLGLGGMILGKGLLGWMTGLAGKELEFGGRLASLMWLVTGLETMNGFLASLCQLRRKLLIAATLNSITVVLGTIGGAVFLAGRMGVEGLVAGWFFADLFSLMLMSAAVARHNPFRLKDVCLKNPEALAALGRFVPIFVSLMPFTILPLVDAYYASNLPEGSMSFLGYSSRAVAVISVLLTGMVYAALLPFIRGNAGNEAALTPTSSLRTSLKVAFAAAAPVALFCYFFRGPLIEVFLQRGAFDARSAAGVSGVLPYYLMGLVAMCLATLVNRTHAAGGRYGRFGLLSLALAAFYVVAAGTLSRRYSCQGIGMAYASYWTLFLAGSAALSGRSLIDRGLVLFWAKAAVNSITAVVLVYMVSLHMPFHPLAVLALCVPFTVALLAVIHRHTMKGREPEPGGTVWISHTSS